MAKKAKKAKKAKEEGQEVEEEVNLGPGGALSSARAPNPGAIFENGGPSGPPF